MYPPTTHQHMTAEKFAALPEGPPYYQLVEGELYSMATPNVLHQEIVLNLAYSIKTYLRANPTVGRIIISPSEVKLDEENIFVPDLYFVSRERAGVMTKKGAIGAPDFVLEVLSPSTQRLDRQRKCALYFRAGVREVWLAVPESRRLEIHLPDADQQTLRRLGAGDVLTTPILPGWSLPVGEIFLES